MQIKLEKKEYRKLQMTLIHLPMLSNLDHSMLLVDGEVLLVLVYLQRPSLLQLEVQDKVEGHS